jgi:hypothetical protein
LQISSIIKVPEISFIHRTSIRAGSCVTIKMNIQFSMKKVLFLSLLLLAAIPAVFAQNNSSKLSVVLKAGKITVNKKNITKDWTIASVIKILDSATEKIPGNYIKHVFDNLGIVLFERTENKAATGDLSELQLFMDQTDETAYTPKDLYEGKLNIEEVNIDRKTPIEVVRTALKDYREKEMSEDDIYRFSKDGVYILLKYDRQMLQKVSFGKDKATSL